MNYIVMDLEWNGGYSRYTHGYFNEILEIGAVSLDESMTVRSEFQVLIRPSSGGHFPIGATNDRHYQDEAAKGIPFTEAMPAYSGGSVESRHDSHLSQTDLHMMEENCRFFFMDRNAFLFWSVTLIFRRIAREKWHFHRPSSWGWKRLAADWKSMRRERIIIGR